MRKLCEYGEVHDFFDDPIHNFAIEMDERPRVVTNAWLFIDAWLFITPGLDARDTRSDTL